MHWPVMRQLQMGEHLSIKRCQEGCEKLWTGRGTHGVSQSQLSNRGQSFFLWSDDWNLNANLPSGASHPLQAPLLVISPWPLLTIHMERAQLHVPQWLLRGQWRVSSDSARGSKQLVMGYEDEQSAQAARKEPGKQRQEVCEEGLVVWHTWRDFILLEIRRTEGLLSLAVSMDVKFKLQEMKCADVMKSW